MSALGQADMCSELGMSAVPIADIRAFSDSFTLDPSILRSGHKCRRGRTKSRNLRAVERENRHTNPPYVATTRCHTEQFLPMIAVETHLPLTRLPSSIIARMSRGVLPECRGHPVDIASQLIVADECRPEGAAKGEAFVENFRDQAFIGVVPHILVEYAHRLFAVRQ